MKQHSTRGGRKRRFGRPLRSATGHVRAESPAPVTSGAVDKHAGRAEDIPQTLVRRFHQGEANRQDLLGFHSTLGGFFDDHQILCIG